MPILVFLLNNKFTWFIGAAIILIGLYFGWRAHQRGIGAANVIKKITEAARKHELSTAEKVRRADESLADPGVARGVRERHSRD